MNIPKLRQALKELLETETEAPVLEMSDISMLQEEDSTGTPIAKRTRSLSQSPSRSTMQSPSHTMQSPPHVSRSASQSEGDASHASSQSPSRRTRSSASSLHQALEAARLEEKAKTAVGVKRVQRGRGVKRASRETESNETILEDKEAEKQVDAILEEEEERSKRRRMWRWLGGVRGRMHLVTSVVSPLLIGSAVAIGSYILNHWSVCFVMRRDVWSSSMIGVNRGLQTTPSVVNNTIREDEQ